MAEVMGRTIHLASEATNSSPPDTGNIEVLAHYGNAEQSKKWLIPLLNGEIRSAFSLTEYGTASSDATNVRTSIRQEGDEIVINGHKWCAFTFPLYASLQRPGMLTCLVLPRKVDIGRTRRPMRCPSCGREV
jgi:alkylation response protein AidB-like acyl-CoA dehydrogenase